MKVACVQTDVVYNKPHVNAEKAVQELTRLSEQGVDLAIFPEAFLTGYCIPTYSQATSVAINRDHGAIDRVYDAAYQLKMTVVMGFAEEDVTGFLYNTAVLLDPKQDPRFYRKTHLPYLGYDKYTEPGEELEVFDTRLGKIGILICFDLRPPEAARTLALKGADIIVLPTNWPVGAEVSAEHMAIARAAENRVFMATCNRVGTENGTSFIGKSKIVHCSGKVLAEAGAEAETLVADVDLTEARQKRIINIPGEYEMEVFDCRQPNLYSVITEPMVKVDAP